MQMQPLSVGAPAWAYSLARRRRGRWLLRRLGFPYQCVTVVPLVSASSAGPGIDALERVVRGSHRGLPGRGGII
jgi:hypothetical protein